MNRIPGAFRGDRSGGARLVLIASMFAFALPGLRPLAAAPAVLRQPAEGRDPFRPPTSTGPAERPPGLAGLRIVEAVVRGILRTSAGARTAVILETPAGEGEVATPGAELFDGSLLRVEADGAVFLTDQDPPREFFRPLADPPETESVPASRETGRNAGRGAEPP